jgi:hypothetical protein
MLGLLYYYDAVSFDRATPTGVLPGLVPGTHSATISEFEIVALWVPATNAGMTPMVCRLCEFATACPKGRSAWRLP